MENKKFVFDTKKTKRYRFPTHTNELIMDRAQSQVAEAFIVILEKGESPPLHLHNDYEQLFYILEGEGTLEIKEKDVFHFPIKSGDFVRIPVNINHRIICMSDEPVHYLSIDCFVGAQPREEPTWESHVKVMCETNGWDFAEVCGHK